MSIATIKLKQKSSLVLRIGGAMVLRIGGAMVLRIGGAMVLRIGGAMSPKKIANKQKPPKGCFCSRTSIRNIKISESVVLAMAELAYVFDDSTFALTKKNPSSCTNLTSTVKLYHKPHPFFNYMI